MISISLCMIVKNEEPVLSRCIESILPAVDELIIVDTGSTDKTKEIAARYTDKVFDFEWIDDFSAARNEAFSHATKDYCMWLDADDVIEKSDLKKLKALKETLDPATDFVFMQYHIAFDAAGIPTYSYYRERLIARRLNAKWQEPIHEVIAPFGKIVYSDVGISHKKEHTNLPGRNLKIFERHLQEGKQLSPRLQYYYGRELMFNQKTEQAIGVFESFLASDGWFENKISACRDLANCKLSLKDERGALESLYQSFLYDLPRAEVVCAIANIYMSKNNWRAAEYWYQSALRCSVPEYCLGFVEKDYYDFIPTIQLCVIYDKLGNRELAVKYNEAAAKIKPAHPSVRNNRAYFSR